jgi:hypothetical protein
MGDTSKQFSLQNFRPEGYQYPVGLNQLQSASDISSITFLLVAGGGGGAFNGGGGGGAGLVYGSGFPVTGGTPYPVTIGEGGAGALAGNSNPAGNGANGTNSVFSTVTALGGGGGGVGYNLPAGGISNPGMPGGSGGGGGNSEGPSTGGTATSYVLTRDTRFDEDAEIKRNTIFSISLGSVNANTKWYLSSDEPIVIGTSNISFAALGTTVLYPSAAKYPTDVNVGTAERTSATMFVEDFRSMLNTIQYDISGLETSFASVTAEGLKWMASSNINTMQNS